MESESYIEGFKVHGLLGEGGQANVYLGSRNQQLYAIKVYFPGNSRQNSFKQEVQFLQKLKFKYLINIMDSKIDGKVKLDGQDEITRPIIILEFAQGGELFEYIAKQGKFPSEICRSLFKMLLESIEYLDSIGIAHRDLKPQNILFDKNFYLKVSDFGLSTLSQGHDGDGVLYTKLGTEGYKPPEMEKGKYSGLQSDLFAAGVILFVMYAGSPPFISTKDTDKIYKMIREENYTKFWHLHQKRRPAGFFSDPFKRLMNGFFTSKVEKRHTIQSLKEDQWLNSDQAMQDDIYNQMKGRYNKMLENDANKRKIEAAKIELMQSGIMEEENDCCGQNRDISEGFLNVYKENKQIKFEELPFINKEKILPIKNSPAFTIAYLSEYIKSCEKSKQIFVQLPYQDIEPEQFSVNYIQEDKKIQVKLSYKISEEDSVDYEDMKITGRLIQMKENQWGIDWQKDEGNQFWLQAIVVRLNNQLQALC